MVPILIKIENNFQISNINYLYKNPTFHITRPIIILFKIQYEIKIWYYET